MEMTVTNEEYVTPEIRVGDLTCNLSCTEPKKRGYFKRLWDIGRPTILCPGDTPSKPSNLIVSFVALFVAFGVLVSLLGSSAVPPHGEIFQMATLVIVAYAAGWAVSLLRLPPLLGMLLAGITLRNIGIFNVTGGYIDAVATLRKIAMVVILTKAGLGLDPVALRRLSCVVMRLAFCPCLVEVVTVTLASRLLLGFSWLWGILLGCVLAAVSPAVVVPSLLGLKERGYGEDKGISTLVIAASSLDDIAAISAFGVLLGVIFSEGSLTEQILQGPLEVAMGLLFGICYGMLLIYIPHPKHEKIVEWRSAFVGGGGILAILGSQRLGYDGAGPLGCILAAFVASCGWRAESSDPLAKNPVEQVFSLIWKVFQPVLFGLIGTEIVVSKLDQNTVVLGLAVLCIGLVFRVVTVMLITLGGILSPKEMFFVAIAWFPKATVQAALGPVALDIARKNGASSEVITMAEQVLTVAVLSILVTAPLGAVGISLSGPRLLSRQQDLPQDFDSK